MNELKYIREKATPYLFILPTFVLLVVFFYYAVYMGIMSSFQERYLGMTAKFIGFENYKNLFKDQIFIKSLLNQAVITVAAVFFSVIFPLGAAELLHFIRRSWIAEGVKKAFVIPMLVPGIVIILTWKYLYNPYYGINSVLTALGLDKFTHDWLNESGTALLSIVFVGFPFVSGLYFLIFHSALNQIGKEIHEAALIDGCESLNIVRYIHLPNIVPFINIVVTLTLIGSLSGFGQVAAMTGGGPGYDTFIPALYMYKIGFGDMNMGYASSMGVVLLVIIMVFTLLTQKLSKSK